MSKTSASAFDMEGIANDYFYRVQNGVMSFIPSGLVMIGKWTIAH